jgi:uncharacterized protein YwlG (UPF0340 family)
LKNPLKCTITILENGKQGFELPEVMAKRGKEVGETLIGLYSKLILLPVKEL